MMHLTYFLGNTGISSYSRIYELRIIEIEMSSDFQEAQMSIFFS